eukprot:13779704-Ditylum_brightwellii.AAC.1
MMKNMQRKKTKTKSNIRKNRGGQINAHKEEGRESSNDSGSKEEGSENSNGKDSEEVKDGNDDNNQSAKSTLTTSPMGIQMVKGMKI